MQIGDHGNQTLLDHEVNANLRDAKGQAPLDVAEANSNAEVLAVLKRDTGAQTGST